MTWSWWQQYKCRRGYYYYYCYYYQYKSTVHSKIRKPLPPTVEDHMASMVHFTTKAWFKEWNCTKVQVNYGPRRQLLCPRLDTMNVICILTCCCYFTIVFFPDMNCLVLFISHVNKRCLLAYCAIYKISNSYSSVISDTMIYHMLIWPMFINILVESIYSWGTHRLCW